MNKKFIAILISILAICGMAMIAGSALATVTSVSITSPSTTTFYKPRPGTEAAGYLSITVTADTAGDANLGIIELVQRFRRYMQHHMGV